MSLGINLLAYNNNSYLLLSNNLTFPVCNQVAHLPGIFDSVSLQKAASRTTTNGYRRVTEELKQSRTLLRSRSYPSKLELQLCLY